MFAFEIFTSVLRHEIFGSEIKFVETLVYDVKLEIVCLPIDGMLRGGMEVKLQGLIDLHILSGGNQP